MLTRGVAGLFAGSIGTGISYISDVTLPAGRGQYLGYIGIPIGLVSGVCVCVCVESKGAGRRRR